MPTVAEVREALGIGDDPNYVVRVGMFSTDGSGPVIVSDTDDDDDNAKVTPVDTLDEVLASYRAARQARTASTQAESNTPQVGSDPVPVGNNLLDICTEVYNEVQRARAKHPTSFNSPHEGYAILKEEVDELWEAIKIDEGRKSLAREEAIQVAAMAVRYILDLNPAEDEEVQ